MEELPKSVWRGELEIAGVTLVCHVLDSGERIIESDGLYKLFGDGIVGALTGDDADKLSAFIRGRGLPG